MFGSTGIVIKMGALTADQLKQLNMYSVYIDKPEHPLFTLYDVLTGNQTDMILQKTIDISQSPNKTVAASYFLRRFGLFISMQFYQLATYDEIWQGDHKHFSFAKNHEFGNQTVSMFVRSEDWIDVSSMKREDVIHFILHDQCHAIIKQMRTVTNLSTLTFWENIFGYLLWHYYVLLENPATADEARGDLELLKKDPLWQGISDTSLFATYLKGSEPADLLNRPVRTTCCFSKDVPGLMECGFCPIKK